MDEHEVFMDEETVSPKHDRIVVRQARDGWRWTRYDGNNGKVIGASTEAYESKADAVHNISTTQRPPFDLEFA